MLVDSHCHLDCLDLSPYDGNLMRALQAAEKLDVRHFLCVCINLVRFPNLLDIAQQCENVQTTLGLHPTESVEQEPTVEDLIRLAGHHPKVVGIGETGLDYYRCEGDVEWQRERFRNHIRAAKALKKPIIVHTRQAQDDTLRIMREEDASSIGGVMHCFTETWEMAKQAMELGFYISFSGIVTFQNAKALHEVAKKVPLEHLLIETDSPYLAPVPYRGKPNEPAYVRYVAEYLAVLKNVDLQTIASYSTNNFFKLFAASLNEHKLSL